MGRAGSRNPALIIRPIVPDRQSMKETGLHGVQICSIYCHILETLVRNV